MAWQRVEHKFVTKQQQQHLQQPYIQVRSSVKQALVSSPSLELTQMLSFLWLSNCVQVLQFLYPSVGEHLACSHALDIVNSAAMDIGVHVSFLILIPLGICPVLRLPYSYFFFSRQSLDLMVQNFAHYSLEITWDVLVAQSFSHRSSYL